MRQLSRTVTVKAPSSFSLAFMSTYFLERGAGAHGAELLLRFPLPRFFVDGLTIEKRVNLHVRYAAHGATAPLGIGWDPPGNGPLPSFAGTLTALPDSDSACRVTIAGGYAPPGGTAGLVFDQLLGVHIARATLDALLGGFAAAIETDYARRSIA